MSYHIPFLKEFLYLLLVCLPSGFGGNVAYLVNGRTKDNTILRNNLGLIIAYAIIVLLAFMSGIKPVIALRFDVGIDLCVLGLIGGACCLIVEYLLGVFVTYLIRREWILAVTVNDVYEVKKVRFVDIVSIVLLVILEEFIYRYLFFQIGFSMQLDARVLIILNAFVFALNHVHWGIPAFIQKCASGSLYATLYILSSYSIVLTVLAHVTQNLALLAIQAHTSMRDR